MKVLSGIYWEQGRRVSNQYAVTVQQVMTGRGRVILAAVSDGIGGLAEGEVASGYILESTVQMFYEQLLNLISKGKSNSALRKGMQRCFYQINRDLNAYARTREIRLGATVSVLLVWKRRYMLVHLGDSRIYLCHQSKLEQLTRDHGCERGLTKCLGSFGFQPPDIRFGHLRGKRGFLLCTDGFYRRWKEKEAGEILSPKEIEGELQIQKRLQTLGTIVYEAGEQDNCSAVYVKVW